MTEAEFAENRTFLALCSERPFVLPTRQDFEERTAFDKIMRGAPMGGDR